MRFARTLSFGFLALVLTVSGAGAQNGAPGTQNNKGRNFGTVPCGQKFSCSNTAPNDLAALAASCTAQGFGIPTAGIFDNASPDGNDCITGNIGASGNATKHGASQCCVVEEGDNCSMSCQLLMY